MSQNVVRSKYKESNTDGCVKWKTAVYFFSRYLHELTKRSVNVCQSGASHYYARVIHLF